MKKLSYYVDKYGSDKNLSNYTEVYEAMFKDIRMSATSILEVGIGTLQPEIPSSFVGNPSHYPHYKPGGSLRAWRDYFPNALVYGVDVAEDCRFEEERIKTSIFSSLDKVSASKFLEDKEFDVIVDDGLHTAIGQIETMKNFFHKVKNGGIYVIEDCGGGGDGTNVFVDEIVELKKLADNHEYAFRGNMVVVKKNNSKKGLNIDFEDFVGERIVYRSREETSIASAIELVDEMTDTQIKALKKYIQDLPKMKIINKELTVTTGLWNINRPGRDFSHYIENFKKFLEIPVNMFIYIPAEYEYLVWEVRDRHSTHVKIYNLEQVKDLYAPFWERTQNIRTDPKWYNQTGEGGWLKGSPQAHLEWYNPIVQSKMFMLNDVTVYNPFDSKYFIWLDAGITNTVGAHHFIDERALDKINPFLDSFLFLSYPYETNTEIHGFTKSEMDKLSGGKDVNYVCRGGLFGGRKEVINEANNAYYGMIDKTLSSGHMGTEESLFTIMSYLQPERYRRYVLDGNGMVVKFIDALIHDTVKLEDIPTERLFLQPKDLDPSKLKTSLYMLTFNFPEQVRHTLQTYEQQSGWLAKTRKILIDNSNNQEAIQGNKKICEEYGMEHIITGENLGINRGRLLAAKHFQESDSDYYIFLEDDMGIHEASEKVCRHGFKTYIPYLFNTIHKIMLKEDFDFLKLSFTEVFMDNDIQCAWYNVPQVVRDQEWPNYSQLPVQGLDPNCPRTKFGSIGTVDDLSYIDGQAYYCNWPMIVGKKGNYKMFLETDWEYPYEQTWMSYIFQETVKGNIKPAILLASPINHNRIVHYKPEERREN